MRSSAALYPFCKVLQLVLSQYCINQPEHGLLGVLGQRVEKPEALEEPDVLERQVFLAVASAPEERVGAHPEHARKGNDLVSWREVNLALVSGSGKSVGLCQLAAGGLR